MTSKESVEGGEIIDVQERSMLVPSSDDLPRPLTPAPAPTTNSKRKAVPPRTGLRSREDRKTRFSVAEVEASDDYEEASFDSVRFLRYYI